MKRLPCSFAYRIRSALHSARLPGAGCCLLLLVACGPSAEESPSVNPEADAARLADVQNLAAGIRDWYNSHGELPTSIGEVQHAFSLELEFAGTDYTYEILGTEDYQLCAVFDTAIDTASAGSDWQHAAGRHCYRLSPTFAQY